MNIFQRFLQWLTSLFSKAETTTLSPTSDSAPQSPSQTSSDDKSTFNQLMDILKGVKSELTPAVIDGECNFNDFLAWFRKQKLDKEKHTPFIMKLDNEAIKTFSITPLTKPCGILIGIYDNTTEEISYYAVQCDTLDAETAEILGNDKLVVLQ